jgi:hypothetical protein
MMRHVFTLLLVVPLSVALAQSIEQRTWTTKKGQTFDATYLRDSGDKVFMKKPDGRQAIISFEALSEADQEYIAAHRSTTIEPPSVDPFADIKPRADDPAKKRVPVTFTYVNAEAKEVCLAGQFNSFRKDPMESDGAGTWTKTVELKPGEHQYKFVVDGKWVFDPNNAEKGTHGKYENSLIKVEAPAETATAEE